METFGYPHEVIALAQRREQDVLTGRYEDRVKAWVCIHAQLLSEPSPKARLEKPKDPFSAAAWSLATAPSKRKKAINAAYKQLRELADRYLKTRSEPIHKVIVRKTPEIILLHIIGKEFNRPLLDKNLYLALKSIYGNDDLVALGVLEGWESISVDQIGKFLTTKVKFDEPGAVLLSFKLSQKFKEKKGDLLRKHYQLLAAAVEQFPHHLENPHLDDVALEMLYKLSCALIICGYAKSMRIPYEEAINYLTTNIGAPTYSEIFLAAYNSSAFIFGIPLWGWVTFGILFLFGHWVHEFWLPASITLPYGIVSVDLGYNIPVLLVIALIVFAYTGFAMFKLKSRIKTQVKKNA